MNIKFLITLIIITLFCSCNSYVQVFETKAKNTEVVDEKYVYENDSIKIIYDFWHDKGLLSFLIYNKLSKPLYIDWKKSAYINKGIKRNYWEDTENTTVVGNTYFNYNSSSNISSSETIKPEKITFIPPKSVYIRKQFYLLPIAFFQVNNYSSSVEITKLNSIDKKEKYLVKDFSKNETPLIFRNFISLSYSENFTNEFYVDNEFNVSKVIKVNQKQFGAYMRKSEGSAYELDEDGERIWLSPFRSGTSFFLRTEK